MKLPRTLSRVAVAAALTFSAPVVVLAQSGDSSAHVPGGFVQAVQGSSGVILRVPVDASGNEHGAAAELRLVERGAPSSSTALAQTFNGARDVSTMPQIAGPASSSAGDSSTTWGWRNWGGYNHGWYGNGYYRHYQPAFYYGYYNYRYNYPTYYYTYSYPYGSYYGWRYYYYPRWW